MLSPVETSLGKFYRSLLWHLPAAILLNCIQLQALASSGAEAGMGVSTNARDLIEFSETAGSKLPANKAGLKDLFRQHQSPAEQKNVRLVIKLSDRRVYVYQNDELQTAYPIAVGREGWETPTGNYQVIQTIENPIWKHPFTGEIVPPGPNNPLGIRWIGFWTDGTNYIGFHGTPNEETVGTAASHGCVRMYNQDVLALFEKVEIGTPVIVEP